MDEKLQIQAAMGGDLYAFNQLVLTYQDSVYNLVCSVLGDPITTEDITQETFVKAFLKISGFRGGSFRAWLFRIAINACYDEVRRSKHRRELSLTLEDKFDENLDRLSYIASSNSLVEDQVSQRELLSLITRSLEELPVQYRSVVILVDVMGLSYAEAARVLHIPLGTLKSRLIRVRMKLRKEFYCKHEIYNEKMMVCTL